MSGNAQMCYAVARENDWNYSVFKELFLAHFWDFSKQASIKSEVAQGRYEYRQPGNMTEHSIRIAQSALLLDPQWRKVS